MGLYQYTLLVVAAVALVGVNVSVLWRSPHASAMHGVASNHPANGNGGDPNGELAALRAQVQELETQEKRIKELEAHEAELEKSLSDATQRLSAMALPIEPEHALPLTVKYHSLEEIPKDSMVWVTFTNGADHYIQMAINWARFVRELNVPHLVVCFDEAAAQKCSEEGIPHLSRFADIGENGKDFRNDFNRFRKMGSNKPLIVKELLETHGMGTIVLSDTDTVWLRDPTDFLAAHPYADVLISTDCLSHQWEMMEHDPNKEPQQQYHRCGHMPGNTYGRAFNTGTIVFRRRDPVLRLLQEWHDLLVDPSKARVGSKDLGVTDQLAFNMIVEQDISPIKTIPEDGRTIVANKGDLKLYALPVLLFNSGHVYFYQHLAEKAGVVPYVVHLTFQRHHTAGKVARMREAAFWQMDSPEYFTEGTFLSYDNDVAKFMAWLEGSVTTAMPDLYKHLVAMAYQLAVLHEAAAMAIALGRVLVLPEWTCYCDQDWYANVLEGCKVHSSDLELPFRCPTDMLLQPGFLDADLDYRLSNFLTDVRTPNAVKWSRETVFIEHDPDLASELNRRTIGSGAWVHFGAAEAELKTIVEGVSHARILHVKQLQPNTFGGFASAADDNKFDAKMRRIFTDAAWCCSGEQPIEVEKIMWPYPRPLPLGEKDKRGVPWKLPVMARPEFCDSLSPELNVGFAQLANHPCNFLGLGITFPESLDAAALYPVEPPTKTIEELRKTWG